MRICPECASGSEHELACQQCLNDLKNVLSPLRRPFPPEAEYNAKEVYILNQVVADLVFEALIREEVSPYSTALLSMKEAFVSALTEQRDYGEQLAREAAAKLEKLGVMK